MSEITGHITDRTASVVKKPAPPPTYEEDPNFAFKVPSLLFVGGTAPYYHDGRAASLEELYLGIMGLVAETGTGFAFPSQTLYLGRDRGLHPGCPAAKAAD